MPDIFQILTEARIREWESKTKEEKTESKSLCRDSSSYEKQLLEEILRLIERAARSSEEAAANSLSSARNLEIQLMASLEKQGLNIAARRIADEIRECENKVKAHD